MQAPLQQPTRGTSKMTQVSIAKPTGGVLPISASATQKSASIPSKGTAKLPTPRLKLVVRRLPPGLTQTEFENALGEEWKVGAGKVDWFQYKDGKVSKEYVNQFLMIFSISYLILLTRYDLSSPAKPSRPSRAYLRVASEQYIAPLAEKVGRTSFLDARNTTSDPVLLGPPSLEFAPFARVPGSRVRKDARQGTIDQDPEFIDFLESLTNPITKPTPVDAAPDGEKKTEAVTTTPLVQYIKEKKASKAKEGGSSTKSSKHGRSEKESKPEKVQAKKLLQRPDKEAPPTMSSTDKKAKNEKATKEAVKIANRQAANVTAKTAKTAPTPASKEPATSTPAPERKRERGNISAAAKILQRDLGLAPPSNRRRAGKSTTTSTDTDTSKTEASQEPVSRPGPTKQPTAAKSSRESKETAAAQKGVNEKSSTSAPSLPTAVSSTAGPAAAAGKPSKPTKSKQSAPSASTQAFLKHANPSQGVTEPLLEAAFTPFGRITKVEIDKKKGFGYIDFAEPEGLQKAIAASPVSVAQSQVVVLERKTNPSTEKSRGKGRNEQQSPSNRGKSGGGRGAGGGGGEGTQSTSRGPRGSRGGSKNKAGNKGGGNAGGAGNSAAAESK